MVAKTLAKLRRTKPLSGPEGDDIFTIIQSCDNEKDLELIISAIKGNRANFEKKLDELMEEEKKAIKEEVRNKTVDIATRELKRRALRYWNACKIFKHNLINQPSPQNLDEIVQIIDIVKQSVLNVSDKTPLDDNPVALEKSIEIISKSIKNIRAKMNSRLDLDRLMEALNVLNVEDRDVVPVEENEAPETIINNLLEAAKEKNNLYEAAYQLQTKKRSEKENVSQEVIKKRYEALNLLRQNAVNSKHMFDDRVNTSNALYTTSTVFFGLSKLGLAARAIPGINFLAECISNSADFLSYFFRTIAQAKDPNIPKAQVDQSNLMLKEFSWAEAAMGAGGTLGILLSIPFGPIPLLVGTVFMAASNAIAARNAEIELNYFKRQLFLEIDNEFLSTKYPKDLLARGREGKLETPAEKKLYREATNERQTFLEKIVGRGKKSQLASKREKEIFRDAMKVASLQHKHTSSLFNIIGSSFVINAAILLVVVAAISFPPAGLAIAATAITALLVAAAANSILGVKEYKKQYDCDLLSRKMAKEIEENDIHKTIKNIQTDVKLKRTQTNILNLNKKEFEKEAVPKTSPDQFMDRKHLEKVPPSIPIPARETPTDPQKDEAVAKESTAHTLTFSEIPKKSDKTKPHMERAHTLANASTPDNHSSGANEGPAKKKTTDNKDEKISKDRHEYLRQFQGQTHPEDTEDSASKPADPDPTSHPSSHI